MVGYVTIIELRSIFRQVFSKDKALIDVRAIYEDDHHTIWIGTSEWGL